jgi:magnesium transporter
MRRDKVGGDVGEMPRRLKGHLRHHQATAPKTRSRQSLARGERNTAQPVSERVCRPKAAGSWSRDMDAAGYPKDSVGELMGPPVGVLPETLRLPEAIEELKRLSTQGFITYLYAVDAERRLTGVIVLKDLFLNPPEKTLADIAIRAPFFLTPEMPLLDAMRAVVCRHFPVYPVCDGERRVVGLVRGCSSGRR